MTIGRFRPRVLAPGATIVPVHPPGYRTPVAYAVIAAVAAVLLLLALVGSPTGFRLFFAGLGVLALGALLVAIATSRSVTPGEVRLDRDAVGLRFAPTPALRLSWAVLAILGVLVGALPYVLDAAGLPATSGSLLTRFSPLAIGLAAFAWLVVQVAALAVPSGLTLTAHGVRGVRGAGRIDLPWDEVSRVEVVSTRGARLVLHSRAGTATSLDGRVLGSDPNLVAPIVEHFRAHPADRSTLGDPAAALALVEAAVSPTV